MLCVISPAKKLDETPRAVPDGHQMTDPMFASEAMTLARTAKKLAVSDLRRLMNLSEGLARLNHDRFAAFSAMPAPGTVFPAIYCFAGDTYQGLDARTLTPAATAWAEGHLRILSGLYGLLRPFDAIQPYRLEMGSRLATAKGPDLYAFWGNKLGRALTSLGGEQGSDVLLNCASVEYFTAARHPSLKLRVVTPVFLEERDGSARIISFWAKKARGAMARFACENRLTDPSDLRAFDLGGYAFRPDLTEGDRLVFSRAERAQQAA